MAKNEIEFFGERLLERFRRYARIDTTSDPHSDRRPSSEGQLELARLLAAELEELDCQEIELDEGGFLFARVPSNLGSGSSEPPEIGLMAHLDTSDAVPGKGVEPQIHPDYSGEAIELKGGVKLDPGEYPELARYRGDTLITSDGTTLLGADDKAGIAEIMVALEYLKEHPELPHGRLNIIFTPDEELGLSMKRFPREKISARYCYTLDGGEEGTIEAECFEGYKALVSFQGVSFHTGIARGKLVNAIEMASSFLSIIPGAESPQATDGRYGFYVPIEIEGRIERADLELYLRDFEEQEVKRRLEALGAIARAVEAAYPGGKVKIKKEKQYPNLRRFLEGSPEVLSLLEEAIRATGLEPERRIIRGGTDGARLSELGIPTPNLFTGGHNFHSRLEWIALSAMVRASMTVVNLVRLWAERPVRTPPRP